jgi:Arc/MetJ-type ribon-helix-helix transcriptional regulator
MSLKVSNTNQKSEKMLLSIPSKDASMIQSLVSSGRYSTKSEVVREALRKFLYGSWEPRAWDAAEMKRRTDNFIRFSNEVRAKIKEKGYTRKDLDRMLEEAKEETRKEVRRMLAEAKRKKK